MTDEAKRETVIQCKSCPWRTGCDPDADIPGYSRELHCGLEAKTIRSGIDSIGGRLGIMACHYSKPGAEHACAGWLYNQLGSGNNIGVRLAVMSGKLPVPEVVGEQHENFEDTLPTGARKKRRPVAVGRKPRTRR